MQDLRKLIGGSRGEVIIARRLTGAELKVFERERGDSDAAVHGHLITKEELMISDNYFCRSTTIRFAGSSTSGQPR